MKLNTYIIAALLGAAGLASCTDGVVVHKYASVDDDEWDRDDTLKFEVPEVKQSGDYEVSVGLRTQQSYPYGNLWLIVDQHYTNPKQDVCDTIQLEMSDKEGNLKGQGVTFEEFETKLSTIQLQEHQKGEIWVRHYMNEMSIQGIHDLGIRIAKEGTQAPELFSKKASFFE